MTESTRLSFTRSIIRVPSSASASTMREGRDSASSPSASKAWCRLRSCCCVSRYRRCRRSRSLESEAFSLSNSSSSRVVSSIFRAAPSLWTSNARELSMAAMRSPWVVVNLGQAHRNRRSTAVAWSDVCGKRPWAPADASVRMLGRVLRNARSLLRARAAWSIRCTLFPR